MKSYQSTVALPCSQCGSVRYLSVQSCHLLVWSLTVGAAILSSGLVCLQLTAHFEPLFGLIGSTPSMLRSQWCLFLPLSAHLPVVLLPTVLTAVSFHCSFSTESVRNRSEFRLRAGGGLCGAASLSRTRSVPEHYRAQCGTRRANQVCRTAARCAFAALHRSQYSKTTGGLSLCSGSALL